MGELNKFVFKLLSSIFFHGWKFTIFDRKNFVLKFLGKMFSSYSPTLTLCLTLKSDYVLICTYFSDPFLSYSAKSFAVGRQKSFDVW